MRLSVEPLHMIWSHIVADMGVWTAGIIGHVMAFSAREVDPTPSSHKDCLRLPVQTNAVNVLSFRDTVEDDIERQVPV